MTATPSPLDQLEALLAKAAEGPWFIRERPTDDGLSIIEDGRQHGMFPVTGEAHEIALIVAAVNHLPALLACARALKPFAEPIVHGDRSPGDARPSDELPVLAMSRQLTVGDFRAASKALQMLEVAAR